MRVHTVRRVWWTKEGANGGRKYCDAHSQTKMKKKLSIHIPLRNLSSMTHLTMADVEAISSAICGISGTNVPATNTDSNEKLKLWEKKSNVDPHGKIPIKDTNARILLFLAGENLSYMSIVLWSRGVSSSLWPIVVERSKQGTQNAVHTTSGFYLGYCTTLGYWVVGAEMCRGLKHGRFLENRLVRGGDRRRAKFNIPVNCCLVSACQGA